MKKLITLYFIIFLCLTNNIFSQQDTTKKFGWFPSGVAALNLSQISLSNWTQGGENALSWVLTGDFSAKYVSESITFDNSLKLAYGRTKLGSEDIRTNDDDVVEADFTDLEIEEDDGDKK